MKLEDLKLISFGDVIKINIKTINKKRFVVVSAVPLAKLLKNSVVIFYYSANINKESM